MASWSGGPPTLTGRDPRIATRLGPGRTVGEPALASGGADDRGPRPTMRGPAERVVRHRATAASTESAAVKHG